MTAINERPAFLAPGFSLTGLCAGFDDPVHQSQTVFRSVLSAMSEPGTLQCLQEGETPEGIHSASYQICLALLDAETTLWISPALKTQALVSALRFHCGCSVVEAPDQADFALITADFEGDLSFFAQGNHEYPDRSTTLIVQVASLKASGDVLLRGPGIDGDRGVEITGLNEHWLAMLTANRKRFPCGVDLVFTADIALMGLPRTTNVEAQPCT
jgi:alpha-D-ribose 1-methylphosphonate 5-triphosphate synthase subunit PhnH